MKKIGIFDKITGKKDKKGHHSAADAGTSSTSKSSKSPSVSNAAASQSQSIQAIVNQI